MFGSDSKYFDKRCEFFAGFFAKASKYEDYVNSGSSSQRAKWEAFYEQSALEDKQLRILAEFRRKMNVLFMSGIWCGDCARQGPIFRRIQE
ncbi:MAG: thioredoxin family protein, partial [Bdellovibrionales bacterium]|nr:thioredoxin family protein [Bdellovibrionales bacterium]